MPPDSSAPLSVVCIAPGLAPDARPFTGST